MVPTGHGEKEACSSGYQLPQGASPALLADSEPWDSRISLRLKQHGVTGCVSPGILSTSRCESWTLWSRCYFDPGGKDSLEQRLGIRLPPWRSLRDRGRGASVTNIIQSNFISSWKSGRIRTLARSQLGLGHRIGDLPFSLQHWPANLHLWTSLS